jgi:hypothetical protein
VWWGTIIKINFHVIKRRALWQNHNRELKIIHHTHTALLLQPFLSRMASSFYLLN